MMVVAIVKIWLCETALANDETHLVHFFGSSVIPHFHSRRHHVRGDGQRKMLTWVRRDECE